MFGTSCPALCNTNSQPYQTGIHARECTRSSIHTEHMIPAREGSRTPHLQGGGGRTPPPTPTGSRGFLPSVVAAGGRSRRGRQWGRERGRGQHGVGRVERQGEQQRFHHHRHGGAWCFCCGGGQGGGVGGGEGGTCHRNWGGGGWENSLANNDGIESLGVVLQ